MHLNLHTHSLSLVYPIHLLSFVFSFFTFVSIYIDFELNNMLFEYTQKTTMTTIKYPFAQIHTHTSPTHTINWMHKFYSMQNFLSSQQTECWPRIIKQLSLHQYIALPENIYISIKICLPPRSPTPPGRVAAAWKSGISHTYKCFKCTLNLASCLCLYLCFSLLSALLTLSIYILCIWASWCWAHWMHSILYWTYYRRK